MKTIFISAELSTLDSAENARRSNSLLGYLHTNGYNFKALTGVYNGSKEKSFAIEVDAKEFTSILTKAKEFSQESVLIVDAKNKATLQFINGKKEKLGTFLATTKEVAEKQGSYFFDQTTGKYYVVQ